MTVMEPALYPTSFPTLKDPPQFQNYSPLAEAASTVEVQEGGKFSDTFSKQYDA